MNLKPFALRYRRARALGASIPQPERMARGCTVVNPLAMEIKVTTRCLVVDDDLEICGAFADYLQGFGMRVAAAADGVQMRRFMPGRHADLVQPAAARPARRVAAASRCHVRAPARTLASSRY
jgi:hypothetical protein